MWLHNTVHSTVALMVDIQVVSHFCRTRNADEGNIFVRILLWSSVFIFVEEMSQSGIAETKDMYIFTLVVTARLLSKWLSKLHVRSMRRVREYLEATKEKTDRLKYIKMKNYCASKIQRQTIEENICNAYDRLRLTTNW